MKTYRPDEIAAMPFAEVDAALEAFASNSADEETREKAEACYGYYRNVVASAVMHALAVPNIVLESNQFDSINELVAEVDIFLHDDSVYPLGAKGDARMICWLGRAYQMGLLDFGYDEGYGFGVLSPFEDIDLVNENYTLVE